jgi:mRNA interferase YafQ
MRAPSYSTQFARDVKRLQKRGKDLGKLKTLIEMLLAEQRLPEKYKDHPLNITGLDTGMPMWSRTGC